jgi:hypothetical protein
MALYVKIRDGKIAEPEQIVDTENLDLVDFWRDDDDSGFLIFRKPLGQSTLYEIRFYANSCIAYTGREIKESEVYELVMEQNYNYIGFGFLQGQKYELLHSELWENTDWQLL